jgi:hypothetical protein
MIISHRYKFIFIKIHKTAGSSMEMALGPLCGPDDIVTPLESTEGTDIPRNYHENTLIGRTYAKSRLFRKLIDRRSPLLGKWYWEHMPATRVRELIGRDIWDGYYKFCFERNPWDKVVSYYNWKKFGQKRDIPPFKEYVMKKSHRLPRDADLYFDGDTCMMDEVFDYQNFQQTFAGICERLGIPYDGVMPREKTGVAKEKSDPHDYYDDETREKVAELFSREILRMNYQYD